MLLPAVSIIHNLVYLRNRLLSNRLRTRRVRTRRRFHRRVGSWLLRLVLTTTALSPRPSTEPSFHLAIVAEVLIVHDPVSHGVEGKEMVLHMSHPELDHGKRKRKHSRYILVSHHVTDHL